MSAAQRYEAALSWRTPEVNQRPTPLFPAPGEGYPCYPLDEQHVALIHSVPARLRGRVLFAERDRDPALRDYVMHVAIALSGPASWPVLWRLDRTRLEYSGAYRVAATPGHTLAYSDAAGQFAARLAYRYRGNLLHVHLIGRRPTSGWLRSNAAREWRFVAPSARSRAASRKAMCFLRWSRRNAGASIR